MDLTGKLAISYYKTIAVIDEPHKVYLVQHMETRKIYVKKVLDVYNADIYKYLHIAHIKGTPRIIHYYEENKQLVIIEEFISGCSLQDKIKNKALSIDDILSYTKDLCLILKQLHTAIPAIVHRDIKPSNVIITSYNRAVLLDFNAAKYYTPSSSEDTVLLGTQGYAAPEQYGFGASSPQTDIYSLGIMLREMAEAVTPQPHIFDAIIEKCTQLRPSERFGDVTELENALASLAKKAPKKQYMNVLRKYALPGFRTSKPWKMLIAVPVYLFILWLCLTLEVKNTYGFALWAERLITLLMMLFLVFGTFNYMDVQQAIPLCQHKKRLVRILGVILLDLAVIMGLFVILLFIVSFIAPALPL